MEITILFGMCQPGPTYSRLIFRWQSKIDRLISVVISGIFGGDAHIIFNVCRMGWNVGFWFENLKKLMHQSCLSETTEC